MRSVEKRFALGEKIDQADSVQVFVLHMEDQPKNLVQSVVFVVSYFAGMAEGLQQNIALENAISPLV